MCYAAKGLYGLTVLLLAWAPFPFASNRPWSWSLLAVMAAVLIAYWGLTVLFIRRPSIYLPKGFLWIALAFGLAWGWAWFQIWGYVPEEFAHQIWSESAAALSSDSQGRISVNPYATMTSIMRLTTYAFIFWLTMQLTVASDYASAALRTFVIICTSYAIYGLAVQFSGTNLVLWYPKPAYTDVVTSTFINRNSFATYLGLGLLCAIAIVLDRSQMILRAKIPLRKKSALLIEEFLGKSALWLISILCLLSALLLTSSRGGNFGFLLALICLLVLFAYIGKLRWLHAFSLAAVTAALLSGAAFVSGQDLENRLSAGAGIEDRLNLYAITAEGISDSPILGTGYGSFADIFPMYRNASIPGSALVDKAHNTYLETVLELGLPFAICLFAAVFGLSLLCFRGLQRRRRNRLYPAIGIAITFLVAAHSLIDFSLQIPAVAVSYAFLMGIAVAQSESTRTRSI